MGCCCEVGIPNCLLPTSCFESWVIFRCGPPADQSEAGDNCFVYNKWVLVIEIESVAKTLNFGSTKKVSDNWCVQNGHLFIARR